MTTTTDTGRWAELGQLVQQTRKELALSTRALAIRAGLDPRTLARIESGDPVQPRRLDALDSALGWEPGAGRAFLAGRIDYPAEHRVTAPPRDDLELLLELRKAAQAVDELSAELLSRLGSRRR